jgi:hypothetical protein
MLRAFKAFPQRRTPRRLLSNSPRKFSITGRYTVLSKTLFRGETVMAKVKLNFQKLVMPEKIARARLIVEKITGNAATFPNPVPALADVTAAINAAEQAYNDALEARALSKQRTAELSLREDELEEMVGRLASFVDTASEGKEEVILSAGMDVRAPSIASNVPPGNPTGLAATLGDNEGQIDVSWNFDSLARSYILQISPNPPTENSWTQAAVVTTSSTTVKNLTSGVKYWFRVAAVGAGGQSGWSDPAVSMAP